MLYVRMNIEGEKEIESFWSLSRWEWLHPLGRDFPDSPPQRY